MPDKRTPESESRFNVKISVFVEELGDDGWTWNSPVEYGNAPYETVLAVQAVLLTAEKQLMKLGFAKAAEKGLGVEKLAKLLGVDGV